MCCLCGSVLEDSTVGALSHLRLKKGAHFDQFHLNWICITFVPLLLFKVIVAWFRTCSNSGGVTPGEHSLIWAIQLCAAPKGMNFRPFWSEIGHPFWHSRLELSMLFRESNPT